MTTLNKVEIGVLERCISWAKQHGYVGADAAAMALGELTGREMCEDQPYYGNQVWRDVALGQD